MEPIVTECKEQMEKSVRSLSDNFGKLRSAQANPSILNGIKADYYGDKIAISDICSITKPEPRQLVVKPYSHEDLKAVAAAITAANIGKITIDFHVIIAYGVNIETISETLISTVKYQVEEFTGLKIEKINIYVEGVRVID